MIDILPSGFAALKSLHGVTGVIIHADVLSRAARGVVYYTDGSKNSSTTSAAYVKWHKGSFQISRNVSHPRKALAPRPRPGLPSAALQAFPHSPISVVRAPSGLPNLHLLRPPRSSWTSYRGLTSAPLHFGPADVAKALAPDSALDPPPPLPDWLVHSYYEVVPSVL